jgi:hypothetical protein
MGDLSYEQSCQAVELVEEATSNTAKITPNGEVRIADMITVGNAYGALSVSTSAVELKVGGAILTNRKAVHFQPKDNGIFWGYSNAVTTSTGTEMFKDQIIFLPMATGVSIWFIATGAGKSVRIAELS